MTYLLRFGPLVAGVLVGLGAVLESYFPGYQGVLGFVLTLLGSFLGLTVDPEVSTFVGDVAGFALISIGVARKLIGKYRTA